MSTLGLARHALTSAINTGSETDDQHYADYGSRKPRPMQAAEAQNTLPTLSHRMRHDKSILALALSSDRIFAGTQGGEIIVYSLDTYERVAVIEGHKGSILDLCLSEDESVLFSTAGDRYTNVWDTKTLERVYCLYSTYDIGDVFCVCFSDRLRTVYIGSQNTTIQWYDLKEKDRRPRAKSDANPLLREDRFFDSSGPGGIRTPRPAETELRPKHAKGGQVLEIDKNNVLHFAHYGYVYCMLLARDVVPEAPGEDVLISGGGDGAINIWRLDKARGGAIDKLCSLYDDREEGHSILSIALDGTFLYSGRSGGEVDVWDIETRQLVRSLKAHRDDVLTIAIGGGYIFSAAVTGFVRVWLLPCIANFAILT